MYDNYHQKGTSVYLHLPIVYLLFTYHLPIVYLHLVKLQIMD
jgi:hypothetical protein